MPSDLCNLTMTKTIGLIFLLLDVTLQPKMYLLPCRCTCNAFFVDLLGPSFVSQSSLLTALAPHAPLIWKEDGLLPATVCSTCYTAVLINSCLKRTSGIKEATMKIMRSHHVPTTKLPLFVVCVGSAVIRLCCYITHGVSEKGVPLWSM